MNLYEGLLVLPCYSFLLLSPLFLNLLLSQVYGEYKLWFPLFLPVDFARVYRFWRASMLGQKPINSSVSKVSPVSLLPNFCDQRRHLMENVICILSSEKYIFLSSKDGNRLFRVVQLACIIVVWIWNNRIGETKIIIKEKKWSDISGPHRLSLNLNNENILFNFPLTFLLYSQVGSNSLIH